MTLLRSKPFLLVAFRAQVADYSILTWRHFLEADRTVELPKGTASTMCIHMPLVVLFAAEVFAAAGATLRPAPFWKGRPPRFVLSCHWCWLPWCSKEPCQPLPPACALWIAPGGVGRSLRGFVCFFEFLTQSDIWSQCACIADLWDRWYLIHVAWYRCRLLTYI
jgi:hypothetical protein